MLFAESATLKGSEIRHRVSLSKLREEMVSFAVRALLGLCSQVIFYFLPLELLLVRLLHIDEKVQSNQTCLHLWP